ncbi:MAG TPA: YdeI/OmpD-associated family protein [Bacteroidia bacterium]|nr:YdeI/OmpD-associated family protein [Bacteroidia bacterium]
MSSSRIDAYIEKANPFARPILIKLRSVIHKACPEVTETIKWGMPFFEYKGPMCNFAAFKQHCTFGFWKNDLIKDPNNHLQARAAQGGDAMGNLGRITSVKDLPADKIMIDFIKQAMKLNEQGIKVEKKISAVKKEIKIPEEFQLALKKNKKSATVYENFSPSHQREYLEWITEAKTEATRSKRISKTIEMLSEGKDLNWKYKKK